MDGGRTVVRKLPSSVAISGALHAVALLAVLAWQPWSEAAVPAPAPPPIEVIDVVVVPRPAIDAARLDDAAVEPAPRPRAPAPAPRIAAVTLPGTPSPGSPLPGSLPARSERPAPAGVDEPAPEPGPVTRNPLLDMRRGGSRPDRVDLRLRGDFRDDLDRVPAGSAPERGVAETGALEPAGGGTYRSDQGVFVARIGKDGSVDLKDSRNLNIKLALPRPRQIGEGVTQWYRSDKGPHGAGGDAALAKQVSGSLDSGRADDPSDRGDRSKTAVVPVLRGGFDISDAFMRGRGSDPYAAKKRAFLDATRDERAAIGARHREQQLAQATQLMRRNLDRLWAAVGDPAARRDALFELWDECAETGERATVEGGADARRLVVGFIRARLPRGGADSYSEDELAALNRRRQSAQRFAPYDDSP